MGQPDAKGAKDSDNTYAYAATKDLLLADLAIFEDAIWRNEETGEKRFNFFVTLVTAVGAGLAALWTTEEILKENPDLPLMVTWQASLGLLIFGLLSFMRMMHRDGVTSEYKHTMRHIRATYRDTFAETDPRLKDYHVPVGKHFRKKEAERKPQVQPQERNEKGKSKLRRLRKRIAGHLRRTRQGGYTVSLAFMNGILLTVTMLASRFGTQSQQEENLGLAATSGALLALALCIVGSRPHDDDEGSKDENQSLSSTGAAS